LLDTWQWTYIFKNRCLKYEAIFKAIGSIWLLNERNS
jgi:hypothetical protein